jgi:hypothetical protein
LRAEWNIVPGRMIPTETDRGTYWPADKIPDSNPLDRERMQAIDRWHDALRFLINRFVPEVLVRSGWDDFLGACVMCDPPEDYLLEFAAFGRVYPTPFWPTVDCEVDEIDMSKIRSMVAPPIERVFKENYGDGDTFMEYRIVVDEYTKKEDVVKAFFAIKAASGMRTPRGKPAIDKLTAIQCAVLYDDHNGTEPDDRRVWKWPYAKLADRFGLSNGRSAEEHVKRGRELRKKFYSP